MSDTIYSNERHNDKSSWMTDHYQRRKYFAQRRDGIEDNYDSFSMMLIIIDISTVSYWVIEMWKFSICSDCHDLTSSLPYILELAKCHNEFAHFVNIGYSNAELCASDFNMSESRIHRYVKGLRSNSAPGSDGKT